MRLFLLFLSAIVIVTALPRAAFAQEDEPKGKVVECGVPSDGELRTDPAYDYCDIFARQLAYREKQKAFRALMEERRKNYAAPRRQAVAAYRAQAGQASAAGMIAADTGLQAGPMLIRDASGAQDLPGPAPAPGLDGIYTLEELQNLKDSAAQKYEGSAENTAEN